MALIDLKSNLAYNGETVDNIKNDNQTGFTAFRKQGDETEFVQSTRGVDSQFNQNIGGTNTTNGNFQLNQEQNVAGQSNLTDLPRPDIDTDTSPPEIKGREQALQAVEDVGAEKTALFVAKQTLLHTQNAQEDTRVYDPTALVKNLVVPGGTDNIVGRGTNENESLIEKAVSQDVRYDKPDGSKTRLGTFRFNDKEKRPSNRIDVKIDSGTGTFENEKLSLGYQKSLPDDDSDLPNDFIKFYIKDVVGKKVIQFPAYLTDITDNSSAEYNPTRYIGRADQVYVYSGYSRSISFGFRAAALTRGDIPVMWRKIDRLKRLALPKYDTEAFGDGEPRPKAPFVELTLGNLYRGQPGYFSSINLTIPQNSNWEISDGYQLTHLCDISLEFTFIGKDVPSLDTPQFDRGKYRVDRAGTGNE